MLQILQQAKNLICNIRNPTRNDHERRVRDFSRYMESEMLRIPESSWDECSFTIMNVIRGFKAAQQPGHVALRQPQAYQQVLHHTSYFLYSTILGVFSKIRTLETLEQIIQINVVFNNFNNFISFRIMEASTSSQQDITHSRVAPSSSLVQSGQDGAVLTLIATVSS